MVPPISPTELKPGEQELLCALALHDSALDRYEIAARTRLSAEAVHRSLTHRLEPTGLVASVELQIDADTGCRDRGWTLTPAGETWVDQARDELTPSRTIEGAIRRYERLADRLDRLEARLQPEYSERSR